MPALLPLLLALTLLAGVVAGRAGVPQRAAGRVQAWIYWLGLPLGIPILAAAPVAHASLAVPIGVVALGAVTALAWAYARRAFGSSEERAAFTLTALWPNTGALGVPVTLAILGPDAVPAAVLYGSLVAAPVAQLLGGSIARRGGGNAAAVWRAFVTNPSLVPVAGGLAWALSGLPVPGPLGSVAQGAMIFTSFAAFLAAGVTLACVPLAMDRDVAVAVGLRVGVSPTLLLAGGALVPMPRGFLLQAAMASGLSTFSLASANGLPLRRVAPAFAWSTGLVLLLCGAWLALA
jgi:hypothetical protein